MSKVDFEKVTFGFISEKDPSTGQPLEFKFESNAFVKIEGQSASKALFKMAAHQAINNEAVNKVQHSVKYQVLCE